MSKKTVYEIYILTSEIANELRVSMRTVQNWIKTGQLKGEKFGRDYRVTETSYLEFKNRKFIKVS